MMDGWPALRNRRGGALLRLGENFLLLRGATRRWLGQRDRDQGTHAGCSMVERTYCQELCPLQAAWGTMDHRGTEI